MNRTAALSALAIIVVIGSLKCNANKTELVVAVLETRARDKATTVGTRLAIAAAKNSSDMKAFFDKYEVVIDGPYRSQGSPSNAIAFSSFALKDKPQRTGLYPLILLGPNRPDEVSPVLNVVRYYRKLMVTYLTTNPEVNELKDLYGFTFAPTAFAFNAANFRLMDYFNWKRAAIVYDLVDKGGLYVKVVSHLINNQDLDILGFEAINTGLLLQQNLNAEIRTKLEKLKDLDAKIFLGEFNARGASLVFCELFKMGLYGPGFVWILHPDAGTIEDWYQIAEFKKINNNQSGTCTKEQYQKAADGAFILEKNILYRSDENTTTASGLTLREVFSKTEVRNLKDNSEKIEMATAFDAMWAIVLALKEASIALQTSRPLEYNVENVIGSDTVTRTIKSKLRNVSFEGLTGPISFTQDEKREGIIVVKQFQDIGKKLVPIGQHFTAQDKFVLFEATKNSLWNGNEPPKDRSVRYQEFMMIPLPLIIIMWLMAAVGIICSLGFLHFNISNRKTRIIKMSSPNLNNIIILGCILCYISVVLLGLDARILSTEECTSNCSVKYNFLFSGSLQMTIGQLKPRSTRPIIEIATISVLTLRLEARATVLCVGFSLAFGAMFSKTWRVHKIFTAATTNKKMAIKDVHLLVIVAGLLAVDVVFLSCWIAIDPLQAEILTFKDMIPKGQDIIIIPVLYQCTGQYKTYFLGILFAYKGLLLLFGLFLAWETRNVSIPTLNDSRYIGMSVYNVAVLSIIGAIVAFALDGSVHYEALYVISSLCLIGCTSVTLLLVFVPKIREFKKRDEAGNACVNLELTEGQISSCKATQTDFDVPESAGAELMTFQAAVHCSTAEVQHIHGE